MSALPSFDNETSWIVDAIAENGRILLGAAAACVAAGISLVHVACYWVRKCRQPPAQPSQPTQIGSPLAV